MSNCVKGQVKTWAATGFHGREDRDHRDHSDHRDHGDDRDHGDHRDR
jgi:hypothetical protein